jgi:hypothetical protein
MFNKFSLKNQIDIFKNKLRTHIFSFVGSFAPQALKGKSQNEKLMVT